MPLVFADAFGLAKGVPSAGSDTKAANTKSPSKEKPADIIDEVDQPAPARKDMYIARPEAKTVVLEAELRWIARKDPDPMAIKSILTILIQERQIKPTSQHYEALILANCDPEEGSADSVRYILEEMATEGLVIDIGIYAAALDVLAIHPSLPLTWSILSTLSNRYMIPAPSMANALLLTYIRTSQLELANDILNDLHKANKPLPRTERTPIPRYYYILFIRALVENKDYEGVIRWLYRLHDRKAMDMNMPAETWGWVLENAARDGDGWVTGWIWQDWVEKMKVRPPRQTCYDVMKIAAKDGVPWLAESVKDVVRHGGFIEASGPETMLVEDWTHTPENPASTDPPPLPDSDITTSQKYIQDLPSSQRQNVGYDENDPGMRAYIRLHQAEIRRRAKQTSNTDPSKMTVLSKEEEGLLDQAYTTSELVLNRKRGFKGVSLNQKDRDGFSQEVDGSGGNERKGRKTQVKPGNLWPWFKNIEGYGNPRFDPWKGVGPKSRS